MSSPLPEYDASFPSISQNDSWSCSCTSIRWTLFSWGRAPDEGWLESSMVSEGVVSPDLGCLDASGQGLAAWVERHYAEDGYESDAASVDFDDVAREVQAEEHPVAIGGAGWYHWSGCASYDAGNDLLILKNPAPGWKGVNQTMNRAQWATLGPWHMVRVMHPAAEGAVPTTPLDYGLWEGQVGSGLIAMMAEDNTLPAQSSSTWLPLDSPSADVETCYGESGVLYVWLLGTSQGFRYRPS